MDFSTKQQPPVLPPPPEHKLVGARKRKPTNISKISSNSTSPQKSPHRDDEEENEYEERNCEPNNNKIQSILSELKFAKQRNKLGGGDDVGRGVGGGRGRFGGSPVFNHFVGGLLEEQDKPATTPPNGLRLPPPPSMIMMPPAHAHVHTTKTPTPSAHFQPPTTRVGGATGSLLQDEPLDLSVDAVDLSKSQSSANIALMMMMMGGSGGERGDKRFTKHATPTLPSPPPSPPPNIPMDLTRSSTSPRALVSKSHYDKVLMIGGKLDTLPTTTLHEYSNDKVSSSFGSPPSSIGSNAQDQQDSSGGNSGRNVRKYQKRKVDDGGKVRGSGGSGQSQGTPPGVKPKQRRYRTERPFHCPHCPARFTLRSNMERHGKHQHATVWQRSPSNRVLNKQRALQAQSQVTHQSSSSSSPPSQHQPHQNLSPVSSGNQGGGNNIRMVLSQQLKRKLSNLESADLASVETLLEKTGNEDFKKYFRSVAGDYDDEEDEEMGEEEEEMDEEVQGGQGGEGEDLRIDEYDDERFREDFYEEDELHPHEDVSETRGKRNLRSRTRSNVNNSSQSNVVTQQKSLSAYSSAPHKIACPHCTRKFPWTSSLRRHLLTHTGQKPFQCSHCPLLFTTKSNCDRHVARKHSSEGGAVTITLGDGGDAILRGKLSEARRDEVVEVEEEIEDVEEEEEEEDYDGLVSRIEGKGKEVEKVGGGGSASFRCHLCELSSSVRSVILKHIEAVHSDNFALMDVVGGSAGVGGGEDGGGEEVGVGNVSNRKVLCAFCIRRFWSVEDLRRHMRSHTGERPFSCQYCSRKFTLKHSLIRHSIRHEKNGESQKETPDDSKK